MFWHEMVTAMRSAHAPLCPVIISCSFPTLLFLIYETPSVWESGRELRWEVEAEERWSVVIAMDPFLYESWHCHMGRAAFWREVMVSSPPAAPWGGLSVNYIQLSLCSVKTGADLHPPPTFPSLLITSYNLRERYSHLARTQWDISEEIACLHVIQLSFFPHSLIVLVSLLKQVGALELQQCILSLVSVCSGRLWIFQKEERK